MTKDAEVDDTDTGDSEVDDKEVDDSGSESGAATGDDTITEASTDTVDESGDTLCEEATTGDDIASKLICKYKELGALISQLTDSADDLEEIAAASANEDTAGYEGEEGDAEEEEDAEEEGDVEEEGDAEEEGSDGSDEGEESTEESDGSEGDEESEDKPYLKGDEVKPGKSDVPAKTEDKAVEVDEGEDSGVESI